MQENVQDYINFFILVIDFITDIFITDIIVCAQSIVGGKVNLGLWLAVSTFTHVIIIDIQLCINIVSVAINTKMIERKFSRICFLQILF